MIYALTAMCAAVGVLALSFAPGLTLGNAVKAGGQVAFETRYFRVASGNNLLITVGPDQWTSWNAGEVGQDMSVSRNVGDETPNSYANWTAGTPPTPGLANAEMSPVRDWALY